MLVTWAPLSYSSVDDAAAADPAPWSAGEGGLEAGLLHLRHQHFLATSMERSAYVDRGLPVGLRSALRSFTAVQI